MNIRYNRAVPIIMLAVRTCIIRAPMSDSKVDPTWRPRGLSKWVISRVISTLNGVTLVITLRTTDLLSSLGLQVGAWRIMAIVAAVTVLVVFHEPLPKS